MLEALKQAQKDQNCSNRKLAEITGVSESTVSRYLGGGNDATFEFVSKASAYLGVSMDEMVGNVGVGQNAVIESQNRTIASQQKTIETMESHMDDHRQQLEDLKGQVRIKDRIIAALVIGIIVALCFAIYWIIDSYNGDWGMVRYEEQLRAQQQQQADENTSGYNHSVPGDVIGLWTNAP